jgi:hypothetical protein
MKTHTPAAEVSWLNLRMSLAFTKASRGWLADDIIASLIVAGVFTGNIEHIDRRPEGTRMYLLPGSVPDEMRQPANVTSVAISVGVPRETARTKIRMLAGRGFLSEQEDGFVLARDSIVMGPLSSIFPAYLASLDDFVTGLGLIDAYDLGPARSLVQPLWSIGGALLRLGSSHVLRTINAVQAIAPDLPFMTKYVLAATCHLVGADLRLLPESIRASSRLSVLRPGASPVSGGAVARFTDLPAETVRRHIRKLVDQGYLVRIEDGYDFNPGNLIFVARWSDFQAQSYTSTRQFIWKLASSGIIVGP